VTLPVLPLRNIVVLPGVTVPLFVGRTKSVCAVDRAMGGERQLFLVAQRSERDDAPTADHLHEIGVIGDIVQLLRLKDGTVKVLVQAGRRARLKKLTDGELLEARIETLKTPPSDEISRTLAREALEHLGQSAARAHLSQWIGVPGRVADEIGAMLSKSLDEGQALLAEADPAERLKMLIALMARNALHSGGADVG
jgi:ATP-dependent Lon protease